MKIKIEEITRIRKNQEFYNLGKKHNLEFHTTDWELGVLRDSNRKTWMNMEHVVDRHESRQKT